MKAYSLFLAATCAVASLTANLASGFSISAVTLSPTNVVPAMTELRMTIDITTPSQGTWLYAPTQISSNANGLRVDVFPTSGPLTAIGSLRETVTLGVFPVGTHNYEVVIHPNFQVNWGTRTNQGSFMVTATTTLPEVYIAATVPETLEPSPNTRVRPGEFTITRIGDTNGSLILFLEFSGTATFGRDYQEVSQYLVMPAGERKLTVLVGPLDDSLVEGDETVIATLSPDPPINSLPNYTVHWRLNQATVVIHDNDFADDRPVVSISGLSTVLEFCPPNADCAGIDFFLRRTGPGLERPLTVFLFYGGTATADVDYRALPGQATFEAGQDFASVFSPPIDDTLFEGDETIIAYIIEGSGYHVDPNRTSATTVIHDNDPPAPPVVSLELVDREAMETLITQNNIDWAEFRVLRTGPATEELVVFLNTRQGSARLGEDYRLDDVTDGSAVRLPAGARSVSVRLYPIDDDFYEGDETVFFHLIAPPATSDPYEIDQAHSSVSMVIHDNDPVTTRLDITAPRDGQHFEAGDVIELRAQIIGPSSSDELWTIDFFDGDELIGTTRPGGAIWWNNAIGGSHVINARAYHPAGVPRQATLVARPITITVGPGPAWPVISLTTLHWPEKTGEPCPVCLVAPGVLIFSRTGPATEPLTVYLEADGTATPGADYQPLPHSVTIPAGSNSMQLLVLPFDDQLVEGPEVVRARIDRPPELATLGYLFNVHASQAFVVIGDDEPAAPEARLDIIEPQEGAQFAVGTIIQVSAFGVWTRGEVDRPVRFFAGDTFIGQSDPPQLLRPTIPCLPSVHTIFWTNPPPGRHVLTARFDAIPGLAVTSPPVNIMVGAEPPRTVVRIEATERIAEEDSTPFDRINLVGVFTISRTGPINDSLPVYVQYSGSATAGEDYPVLPLMVDIPAGATSTQIRVVPIPDPVSEGIETLVATISACLPCPDPPVCPLPPCYDFFVDPAHASATVFIRDDGVTRASLVITNPKEGASFAVGETIFVQATAIDLDGYINRIEFWDGDQLITAAVINFFVAPPDGTPVQFSFSWRNAAPGPHVLTARARSTLGEALRSNPVHITVGGEPPRTVVSIEATGRIAEETAAPLRRMNLVGEFRISRTGPIGSSLPVFVQYSGSATPGKDYPVLPWLVTIPAGSNSTTIRVQAIPDNEPEGIETLVATISNCPPDTDPPLGIPCYGFEIEPARGSATVFLRDDGITEASLVITNPKDGANFRVGETILIEAVAIHLEGYINRVEFWDGERRIGVSEIIFIRAPDPGTPIHHSFEWRDAAPGAHVLTARAGVQGAVLTSRPVHITVGPAGNQRPTVAITQPASGATFPPDTNIEIIAEGRDPDGYVPKVEFFADGRKIGERIIVFIRPPDPGQPQTFSFVWRHPTPGSHTLTARATDDNGESAVSAPVEIRVAPQEPLPIVNVVARDPFAVEPASNTDLNAATFRIRRFGPTNQALLVNYSLHGTAENGVDYETLPGQATIPAGRRSVLVTVRPLSDNLTERIETVVLRLEEASVLSYRVGHRRRAVALISDDPFVHPPRGVRCVRLPDGRLHLCFAAETGHNFRIEATSDFRTWETVFDAVAADGALHFVEDEMANFPHRFYRVTPEPITEADD